jgi:SpoVK/Ycf46/Vps4 family AAA+-type ATPase
MTISNATRTPTVFDLLPELVRAGLAGDRHGVEVIASTTVRAVRAAAPEVAAKIAQLIGANAAGSASVRWNSSEPPPADSDSGAALVRVLSPSEAPAPVLPDRIRLTIDQFIAERKATARLLGEGLMPPRSLLLSGAPGTGKTMLATWLASQLNVRLVVLDLASAMSSYLGKTGSNLRRSLDFARGQPCVFLLDEFDAIAKRRDDATEVGELKRIVNVLLKELEDWPVQSVLVAATNHPELLDPAISRRFDVVVQLPKPDTAQRQAIVSSSCGRFAEGLPTGFLSAVATATEGASASAVVTLTQTSIRKHVVGGTPLVRAFVEQVMSALGEDAPEVSEFARALRDAGHMSVREIAATLGKGSSTIQYHLKKPRFPSSSHANDASKKTDPRKR